MGTPKNKQIAKEQPVSTEIAKTDGPKGLVVPTPGGFFQAPTARDVLIPKILCLHYMSEKVKDKNIEAVAGELRDTLSNEKFGDEDHPLEFIPIGIQKSWTVSKKEGNEFIEKIPWNEGNADKPREEVITGKDGGKIPVINLLTWEVYVVIPSKIKEGGLPYVLSFRSTGARTGQTLASKQFELMQKGVNFWDVAFSLSVKEASNDKGDFFKLNALPTRATTEEERAYALKWFKMMNDPSVRVTVDDSDLQKGEHGAEDMQSTNTNQF